MGEYKSVRGLATVVTVLLALNAFFALGAIGSSVAQLEILERIQTLDDFPTDAELDSNDSREQILGLGMFALYVVTAIAFVTWFKRAYDNLGVFGQATAHGTGWAIGAWFVPILNLFRPFQIAREIWNKSDPSASADDVAFESTPPIIAAWWAAWIVGNILGQLSFRLTMSADSPGEFVSSTMANIATDVVTMVSAPLAILVVRSITARQETIGARLGDSTEPLEF